MTHKPSTSERTIRRSVFISTASRAARLSLSFTLITCKAHAYQQHWIVGGTRKYLAATFKSKLPQHYQVLLSYFVHSHWKLRRCYSCESTYAFGTQWSGIKMTSSVTSTCTVQPGAQWQDKRYQLTLLQAGVLDQMTCTSPFQPQLRGESHTGHVRFGRAEPTCVHYSNSRVSRALPRPLPTPRSWYVCFPAAASERLIMSAWLLSLITALVQCTSVLYHLQAGSNLLQYFTHIYPL